MTNPSSKKMSRLRRFAMVAAIVVLVGGVAVAQSKVSLEEGFQNPPNGARPRVWWHWMNGNITKEGINLDLEWMKRVGLGGFQNFDAALSTPKVVDKRLVYMTPEWKDAFLFATKKADSLGLEMAVAGSPGWSESGGPWVKPEQGMKKLTWSETHVEGGKLFHGVLPKAPSETGPFQNLAQQDLMGAMAGPGAPHATDFAEDVAVIGYREPSDAASMAELKPSVTSNGGAVENPAVLWDGDMNHSVSIPIAAPGQKSWLQFDFGKPQTIQSVSFAPGGAGDPMAIFASESNEGPVFESSDDGVTFTEIVRMPTSGAAEHTMSFAPKTARHFRLSFLEKAPAAPAFDLEAVGMKAPPPPTTRYIAELALHPEARVNRFEEKAGYADLPDLYAFATGSASNGSLIAKADTVDLTAKMQPDGTLDWTPPPGKWTVLRMGYSLTGITNHPAPPEATGPEVDKLNHDDVKAYMEHYLDNYKDASGGMMGKRGLQYVISDSWEAGTQNWTNDMVAEFTKRRGYDPRPWMPVLTGRIVGGAQESDGFLWDLRKTIADLLAENHYDQLTEMLHARGMGHYGESHESGRATIGDGMEMKRSNDVPMSAMWTQHPGVNKDIYGANADIRESASVAHIYGQNLVAAESMTAATDAWAWSPETLKPTADKELAMGLNRFVIHTSVHQPLIDKAPGLALGPFGQWFNRNEVWAEQAAPWIMYLARSDFMLQQGKFVADVLYFYGEDSNITAIFGAKSPDVPEGYNFDYVNADALIHQVTVAGGNLVTPSGMSYRVLVLDPYSRHMSLPVLRRLQQLIEDGATVVGEPPVDSPSLADNPAEFHSIVDAIWGARGQSPNEKLLHGMKVAEAIEKAKVAPDFVYSKPEPDASVLYVHRNTGDADLYFVDNRNDRPESFTATFRVTGKAAELWHADTGKIEDVSYSTANGTTTVPLMLEPYGTVFVVFRKPATAPSRTLPPMTEVALTTIDGPWAVHFQVGRGAPVEAQFPSLASWSENSDLGIRYFSGHGTYHHTLKAPESWFRPGSEIWLDLGEVKNLAEVKLNGMPLGIVWKTPFRVLLNGPLKPGDNTLEVEVANLWVNRLIGDQQPAATVKYTFTTRNPYQASSPLLPSGLLGPVQVIRRERAPAK